MAEIPHNQSSMAEIPHDQSALSKCWETIHIRTLWTKDEEAFPTSYTGPSQRTHILREPIPSFSIHESQVPQLPAQSLNAHHTHPQSPAQLLLSQELLSLPQQELGKQSGFPLPPLHSLSPPSDTLPHWTSGHRINQEIQCHQQLSQTYMNNKSPSRDDSASPVLTYPKQRARGPRSGNQSEVEDPGLCDTRALTPFYNTSSQGDGDERSGGSDKENDEPERPLYARDFRFVHRCSRAARVYWHAHNRFPERLAHLSHDILAAANRQVIPEYPTDIDEHDPVDWAGLYDALQAGKEELARFTEGESDPEEEEGEEDGTNRENIEITRIEAPGSPSGSGPRRNLWDSPGGDNGLSNEQTEDGIMRNLGWVEYDPMQRDSVRVTYQTDDDTIDTCRWVRYELNRTNPRALGTQGMVRPIYEQELHANPRPAPNFSEPCQFRDDALQVFHYNHGSCALVDQALTQLGDVGLEAEVARYRFHMEERDNLALCRQRIEREELANNNAIIRTGRFLANARGASRVGTTLFTFILPDRQPAHITTKSPEPLPVPPQSLTTTCIPWLTTGQGPPDRTASPPLPYNDGQFIFCLFLPDNTGVHDKIPFCHNCQVRGHNEATCSNTKCYFCTEAHLTFGCPTPHCCCTDDHCWVPLSHANHGLVCPAQVNNIDMTKVGQANCDYCEDLLDHETSMAASF